MTALLNYRLVLIVARDRVLMVDITDAGFALPQISVAPEGRTALQLTRAIEDKWHIRAAVLDVVRTTDLSSPCAILEVDSSQSLTAHPNLRPLHLDRLRDLGLKDEELEIIRSIVNCDVSDRGPFSRTGWIDEAHHWVSSCTSLASTNGWEGMSQLNATGTFALIRFEMGNGRAYWLKATGEPNTHELGVTRSLSQVCPGCLPPLVAVCSKWNAWITQDVGYPLEEALTLDNCVIALRSLAELQIGTMQHTDDLLKAGAFDRRVPTLRQYVDPIANYLDEIMPLQTSHRVPILDKGKIERLRTALVAALTEVERLQIPNTLIHNDLNPGNILMEPTRSVFTDWAEACVGPPFLSYQLFLIVADKGVPCAEREEWRLQLSRAYRETWRGVLSDDQMERACQLAPLLSAFSYLLGRGDWLESSRRNQPRFQAYARSLARHMDREVSAPLLLEVLSK